MKRYPKEFKESIIARMLPPGNVSIPALAKENGISRNTLYCWRITYRNNADNFGKSHIPVNALSSEEKFNIVVETAGLNEVEISQYSRKKGIYPEQISSWRVSCSQANAHHCNKVDREKVRNQSKEIKAFKKDLNFKEKALAETAALLVLKKNSTFFCRSQWTTNQS